MRYFLATLCLLLLAIPSASGEPLDCENLTRTNMPYQVTFTAPAQTVKTSDGVTLSMDRSDVVIQVYRHEDGFAAVYEWRSDHPKVWGKIVSRNGFELEEDFGSVGGGSFGVRLLQSYDPDPGENLYASKRDFRLSHSGHIEGGTTPTTISLSYRFIGSDYLVLGPCRFTILRYVESGNIEGGRVYEGSFVYAPELRLGWRPYRPFPEQDPNLLVERKPTKLETDFETFE